MFKHMQAIKGIDSKLNYDKLKLKKKLSVIIKAIKNHSINEDLIPTHEFYIIAILLKEASIFFTLMHYWHNWNWMSAANIYFPLHVMSTDCNFLIATDVARVNSYAIAHEGQIIVVWLCNHYFFYSERHSFIFSIVMHTKEMIRQSCRLKIDYRKQLWLCKGY